MRTEPSAPTEAKMWTPAANARSYTSLSCAISCVFACILVMSQMVHVVSIEDVPIMFGSVSFQSNEVRGAQNSVFLLLLSKHSSRGLSSEMLHSRR